MGLVEGIRIENYLSTSDLSAVHLHEDLTAIVGPNGAGKSSFLRGAFAFTSKQNVHPAELSTQNSGLDEKSPSEIPITTLYISANSTNLGPLRALSQNLSIKSTQIIEMGSNGSEANSTLPGTDAPSSGEEIKVISYANGTKKLATSRGRLNIGTVVENRLRDVTELATKLIEQVSMVSETVSPYDRDETDLSVVQDVTTTLKEEVDDISPPTNTSGGEMDSPDLIEDLSEDLDNVAGLMEDLELLRTSPIENYLPNMRYFEEIPIPDSKFNFEQTRYPRLIDAVLNSGSKGVDSIEDLESRNLELVLEQVEDRTTEYLNSFIKLDEPVETQIPEVVTDPQRGRFSVESSQDGDELEFKIRDEREGTIVGLCEKSTGFRWLFSFILLVFIERSNGELSDLYLIDDIGVHLHPEWKVHLRHSLYEITGDAQIVYSTHSPFLIDNSNIDQVRIASMESNGTQIQTVSEVRGSSQVHDQLEPIRSSLGARVSEFLFGSSAVLVVEGPTDKDYIECMSELFYWHSNSKESLNSEIEIVVGKGSNQNVMANFLEVEEDNYVVLTDKDESGDRQKRKILKNDIDDSKLIQLDELANRRSGQHTEIEDLFSPELVCEIVASELPDPVSKQELLTRVASEDSTTEGIKGRLSRYYDEGDVQNELEIPKGRLAEKIIDKIDATWLSAPGEKKQTVESFQSLIKSLNDKLT